MKEHAAKDGGPQTSLVGSVRIQQHTAAAEALEILSKVTGQADCELKKLHISHICFAHSSKRCRSLLEGHYTSSVHTCHVHDGPLCWLPRSTSDRINRIEATNKPSTMAKALNKLLNDTTLKSRCKCNMHPLSLSLCERAAVDLDIYGPYSLSLKEKLTWAKMCVDDEVGIAILDQTSSPNESTKEIKQFLNAKYHNATLSANQTTVAEVFLCKKKYHFLDGMCQTFAGLIEHVKVPDEVDEHVPKTIAILLTVLNHVTIQTVAPPLPPLAEAPKESPTQHETQSSDPWADIDLHQLPDNIRALKRSFTFVVEIKEYGVKEEFKFCRPGSQQNATLWKTATDALNAACTRRDKLKTSCDHLMEATAKQLKEWCDDHGARKSGNKADLVAALLPELAGAQPTPPVKLPEPPKGDDITHYFTNTGADAIIGYMVPLGKINR